MLNEVDVNKVDEIPELLSDSWRFQIARFGSFKVPDNLMNKLEAFSGLYQDYKEGAIWTRKLDNIPNLEMALSIGMPIHQIMRSVTIQMEQIIDGIHGVAENINAQLKEHGLIPQSCEIIVLASLQLRNISDHTSWASKPFPVVPEFYHNTKNVENAKRQYTSHINTLKNEFPEAGISDFQTVTGSLCDGSSNISSLLVVAGEKNECKKVTHDALKITVKEDQLKKNGPLSKGEYISFYCEVKRHNNDCCATHVPEYATMLLGLLKYWDVMVITANDICLKANDSLPRGLAGFILCFKRDSAEVKEVEDLFPLANALFAPLIHLYAKAAMLEGAQHFYDSRESTSNALHGLKSAIDRLQEERKNLHNHIGGSYGEDLAGFRDDLTFKNTDDASLLKTAFINVKDISYNPGSRGIWHTPWIVANGMLSEDKTRLSGLKAWLQKKCPVRYPHLWDDKGFHRYFVDKVNAITDENGWNRCFDESGDERLELLMMSNCYKKKTKKFGSSDFCVEEFPEGEYTIESLCKALTKDKVVPENENINTIEELNKLLKLSDLYNKIKNEKKQSCSEVLMNHKELYNAENTEDNLKWLNRIALEEYYPQETPKSQKFDSITIKNINIRFPKHMFYGFEVFFPHLEDIFSGIQRNFKNAKASIINGMFVVSIERKFCKSDIDSFSNSVQNETTHHIPYAEWTRTSFMLRMWAKLYRRNAEVVWLKADKTLVATLGVNSELIYENDISEPYQISEYHFFFNK